MTLPHPDLFTDPLPMPGVRHSDPVTSHEAAHRKVAHQATDAAIVLGCLRHAGANGMTADAIEARLGWPNMRAARRLTELLRMQLVTRGPATRDTRTGSPALVWYHGSLDRRTP